MKKHTFITGAFLLAVATGLGKIFSAIFKIPLDRFFLHEEGMAIFNGAYNIYMFFYAAATAGIPLALSRIVASSASKNEEDTAVSTTLAFTFTLLFSAGVIIFVFADVIAAFIGMEESAPAIRVMAPALIFCAVTATLKGYFQGKMIMLPAALSQVSDSFGRLFAGFIMAYVLLNAPITSTAAGAISGVPFGAALSALILIVAAKKVSLHISFKFSKAVLKELLFLAVPITLTASMHSVFNMVDTVTVVPFLSFLKNPEAQRAFGCLSRAAMLYALPVSIATAVATSALPAVAESTKTGDTSALNRDASMAIRLALAISLPCAAGFMAIPKGIITLLFNSSSYYHTLTGIALSAIFLSLGEVLACILQGMGKTKYTVIAAAISIEAKLFFNCIFMYLWGINGAAIATSLSYAVFTLLLLVFTKRNTDVTFSLINHMAKPLICGVLCFAAAFISGKFLHPFFVIIIAAVVYIPSIFFTGFIHTDEIGQIFSGHKIEGAKENLSL